MLKPGHARFSSLCIIICPVKPSFIPVFFCSLYVGLLIAVVSTLCVSADSLHAANTATVDEICCRTNGSGRFTVNSNSDSSPL